MALSAKQQRFVDEYLVDLNATQAAIRAGYAPSTADKKASGWVGKSREQSTAPEIWDAVNTRLAKLQEETGVTVKWIVGKLVENVERSMQATPVLDHEGNPTGEYKYAGNVANKALELLGKWQKMFDEGGVLPAPTPGKRTIRYSRDNEAGR